MTAKTVDNIDDKFSIIACYTCLSTSTANGFSLNDELWFNLLEFCTGLSVKDINEPLKICLQCAESLHMYVDFKQKCLDSAFAWKAIVKSGMKSLINKDSSQEDTNNNDDNSSHPYDYIEIDNAKTYDNCDNENNVKNASVNSEIVTNNKIVKHKPVRIRINLKSKQKITKKKKNQGKKQENEESIHCDKCFIPFKIKLKLDAHRKLCNGIIIKKNEELHPNLPSCGTFCCGLCDMTSPENLEVIKHITTEHSSKNMLKCKICSFIGVDFAQMECHRYTHLPQDTKNSNGDSFRYTCHICDSSQKFKKLLSLEFHYRSIHLNKSGGLCHICLKSYKTLKNIKNHLKYHNGTQYICDYCGKVFTAKFSLATHISQICNNNKNKFVCDICAKSFSRIKNLTSHLNYKHGMLPKKHKCDSCIRTFRTEADLRRHNKKSHFVEQHQYACEYCPKTYYLHCDLKQHMLWHRADRPFACEECGATYKVKAQLKNHIRKHTGEKHFKCEQCSDRFYTTNQRRRHMFVHTGERQYKCDLCIKSFYERRLLNKHYSEKHKEQIV